MSTEPTRILLVEDTISLALIYKDWLERAGYDCDHVERGQEAIEALNAEQYQVVLLDLQLPDMSGMNVLEFLKSASMPSSVIVVTGSGSINTAVDAMRAGAYDFLVKPVAEERLIATANNATERTSLQTAASDVAPDIKESDIGDGDYFGFVGSSPAMTATYRLINTVAQSRASVFVTGESGTGKEVCAEAIHKAGPRADKPFVPINCAAIPKELIESELFGHLKGAFTGATSDRDGAACMADGGTLFLDEICEMDLDLQTKLLRFLQTGQVQKVGSDTIRSVDVRVVCATNRDPVTEVASGRFREDLYYRLHVVPIPLPPLRERNLDVIEIANAFVTRFAAEEGKQFSALSADAEDAVLEHNWPGNVRELQNTIRQAAVLHDGHYMTATMLGRDGHQNNASLSAPHERQPTLPAASTPGRLTTAQHAMSVSSQSRLHLTLGSSLKSYEQEIINATIAHCNGSIPQASRLLDVSPSTIYRKLESWSQIDTAQ